ncbi:hypothetical protein HII36_54780 [Nonomuraea sp. NN258]|uniref:hypothetical protein n=1 Tax=Nonomuraea antri TaxID=2730852 RepID=UPI00156A03BC|nr:hypothetical protein [Nonomuraea antri]NRQ40816.1 hypothetical protein [Nonomuraea antri]
MFLRVAVALQAATLLVQAITAGLLLSSPSGRMLHSVAAIAVVVAGLLHLVAAILVWRPGGGSARGIAPAVGLLVVTVVQMALGMAHMKALHVPLGVVMFAGSVLQLSRLWTGRRTGVTAAA